MITGEGLVTGHNASEALQRLHQEGPRALQGAPQGLSQNLIHLYVNLVHQDRSQRHKKSANTSALCGPTVAGPMRWT